jgi:hypothetical protein
MDTNVSDKAVALSLAHKAALDHAPNTSITLQKIAILIQGLKSETSEYSGLLQLVIFRMEYEN